MHEVKEVPSKRRGTLPQYFGLRYVQIKMAETVQEEFARDKIGGYRRIWNTKMFAIQYDFIFAIFIVQSKHILELTR